MSFALIQAVRVKGGDDSRGLVVELFEPELIHSWAAAGTLQLVGLTLGQMLKDIHFTRSRP